MSINLKRKLLIQFLFIVLLCTMSQDALTQIFSIKKAEELVNKMHKDELLSKIGKSELLKYIRDEEPDIIKYWNKVYRPFFTIKPILNKETNRDFVNAKRFIQFFSLLESLQSTTYQRLSISRVSDPIGLVSKIDSIRGEIWKNNRPKNIKKGTKEKELVEIRKQLKWWLNIFQKYGLLVDKVHNEGNEHIKSDKLLYLSFESRNPLNDFFEFLNNRIYLNQNIGKFISEQKSMIDSIHKYGIIDEKSQQELLTTYSESELKSSIDIIKYFKNVLVIDAKEFQYLVGNTQAQYETFIALLKEHFLPQIDLDSLYRFNKTYEDKEYGGNYERNLVSIKVNGIEYWQEAGNIFPYVSDNNGKVYVDDIQNRNINFINHYLTDQNSDFRCIIFQDMHKMTKVSKSRIAIVLLTANQIKELNKLRSSYFPDLSNIFSYKESSHRNIFLLIQKFQKIGISSDLSSESLDTIIAEMRERRETGKKDLLRYLKVATDLGLSFNNYKDKKRSNFQILIDKLSSISQNKFIPDSTSKGWEKYRENEDYPVSAEITYHGKVYKTDIKNLKEDDDFWDRGGLITFVNSILEDQKIDGKFYPVESKYTLSIIDIIFLTKQQFNYLQKEHPEIFQR